jgi:hypothetical protein
LWLRVARRAGKPPMLPLPLSLIVMAYVLANLTWSLIFENEASSCWL